MSGFRLSPRFALLSLFAGLAVALLGSAGCSKKDSGGNPAAPILQAIPSSWEGVWSVRTTARICNTSAALLDTTIVDTMCAGAAVNEALDVADLGFCENAEVRGTETSMSFACTENFDEEGCTGTFSLNLNTTVNPTNGTFVTTGRLSINSSPDTGECQDFCIDITQNGTRTAQEPACPAVANGLRRVLASPALAKYLKH